MPYWKKSLQYSKVSNHDSKLKKIQDYESYIRLIISTQETKGLGIISIYATTSTYIWETDCSVAT